MTLADYIESGISINTNNSQTRAVAGDVDAPFGACDQDMLARARHHIEERFAAVGITERFDDSLLLFASLFGWSRLHYVRAKVSRGPAPPPLSDRERELIEQLNALDLALYRDARERFKRALAALPDLDARRARLDRANALYRPWATLTYTMPVRVRDRLRAACAG